MKPLVLAELLTAIKRVIVAGETDLTGLHARLYNAGEHVQYKEGRRWVSLRTDALAMTIKALREKADGKKASAERKVADPGPKARKARKA